MTSKTVVINGQQVALQEYTGTLTRSMFGTYTLKFDNPPVTLQAVLKMPKTPTSVTLWLTPQ